MKKILMSMMVLALLAVITAPLTLARPHYNNTNATTGSSNNGSITKDAKNYENLKGNYKTTPLGSNSTANSVNSTGTSANTNNLKSNYAGSNNTSASGTNSVNTNRR